MPAPKIGRTFLDLAIDGSRIRIRRDDNGVVHLQGGDDLDFARALGFAHGCDRMLQMMLLRVIGQGQLCEHLKDDNPSLDIDVFMRRMGFAMYADLDTANLSPEDLQFVEAYCSGVNHYLQNHGRPWEFALVRYRPTPWTVSDTLLTASIMSYIGLAQTQEDLERFIIQALHGGMDPAPLKALFAPHLNRLSDEIVALVRSAHLCNTLIPKALRFLAIPSLSASNNWVLSPGRSQSGHVLQCNDPHLEVNRLPAAWYEFVMETEQGVRAGISMPGVPALVMGRTEHISMGFTYGFMDMIDFFIEDCRGGQYRRGEEFHPFIERREVIHRKRHADTTLTVYENDLGRLDTDPAKTGDLADGHHFLMAWCGRRTTASASIGGLRRVLRARSVPEAQSILGNVGISCNWLLGDTDGNIGYQQSGLLPVRSHSGLYPIPAWRPENLWTGIVAADQLTTRLNPEEGFLVSANGDRNAEGRSLASNASMGPYREDRIAHLLGRAERHSLEDMKEIQKDLYSIQAERIMELLRQELPDTATGEVLRCWDLRYDKESRGATAFEAVYLELLGEVFGKRVFGKGVWTYLAQSTAILCFYHHLFDRGLLVEGSHWCLHREKDLVRDVCHRALNRLEQNGLKPWGQVQQTSMDNIFFSGKLPGLFGFDHGPIAIEGGRATVAQGNAIRTHRRPVVVAPSYRYIADLGAAEIHTSLAGGPSDRRFSPWYKSDLRRWLDGDYKAITFNRPRATSTS